MAIVSDEGWQEFMKQFTQSIRDVVRGLDGTPTTGVHDTVIKEELDSLRTKVDDLTEEVVPSLCPSFRSPKYNGHIAITSTG